MGEGRTGVALGILDRNPIRLAYRLSWLANFYSGPIYRRLEMERGLTRPEVIVMVPSATTRTTIRDQSLPAQPVPSVLGQICTRLLRRMASMRASCSVATISLVAEVSRLRWISPRKPGIATASTIASTATVTISSTRVKPRTAGGRVDRLDDIEGPIGNAAPRATGPNLTRARDGAASRARRAGRPERPTVTPPAGPPLVPPGPERA